MRSVRTTLHDSARAGTHNGDRLTCAVRRGTDLGGPFGSRSERADRICGITPRHATPATGDAYEASRLFGDEIPSLGILYPTKDVLGVDSGKSRCVLSRGDADVAISFGISWNRTEALDVLPSESWNLHLGDPQKSPGLDSHLWALHHRDRHTLVTTLHTLDPDLDRGAIMAGRSINIE